VSRRQPSWLDISLKAWTLGMEASSVIALRTMKIAAGGAAAQAETELMMREKVEAAIALQIKAMTGQLGMDPASSASATLVHYQRKVRANQRRLART
jgi:hypothetical protein